jgi:hypothetical protein
MIHNTKRFIELYAVLFTDDATKVPRTRYEKVCSDNSEELDHEAEVLTGGSDCWS